MLRGNKMSLDLVHNDKVKLVFASAMEYGNFGDLLSRYIVEKMSGIMVEKYLYNDNVTSRHLCAIGSILNRNEVCSPVVVWGSGFYSPQETYKIKLTAIRQFLRRRYGKPNFLAVRGKLSQEIILRANWKCPNVYGDPALLTPFVYPKKYTNGSESIQGEKKKVIGVILHKKHQCYKNVFETIDGTKVIDINVSYEGIETFIDKLLACDTVLSSSLHGLIIANAYKKPCVRLKIKGHPIHAVADRDDFKFDDYLSGLNLCKVDKDMEDYNFAEMILDNDMKFSNLVDEVCMLATVPKYKIGLTELVNAFPLQLQEKYHQIDFVLD